MGGSQSRDEIDEEEGDNTVVGVSAAVAKRLLGQYREEEPKVAPDSTSTLTAEPISFESEAPYLPKKEQVKMFEDYYNKQLKSLKEQNRILRETSQEEFKSAIKEVQEKFPGPIKKASLCKELQDVVIDCYKENRSQPLNCSHEVKTFIDCVHKHSQKQQATS